MGATLKDEETRAERLAALAKDAITAYHDAGQALAEASENLALVERDRAQQKLAAIIRLSEQEHPAAPGKKFSVSQADDFARLDAEYQKYKQRCSDLALAKMEAELELSTARLTAEYAIAAFRAEAGLIR